MPDKVDDLAGTFFAERRQGAFPDWRCQNTATEQRGRHVVRNSLHYSGELSDYQVEPDLALPTSKPRGLRGAYQFDAILAAESATPPLSGPKCCSAESARPPPHPSL
jgi:hypothetical protein